MTRMISVTGRVVLAAMLLAQAVAAGEAGRFQRLFNHYNAIRLALAADTTLEVPYHAERLGVLAGVLAREARRSGREKDRAIAEQLRAVSDAARKVALSADLKTTRVEFAKLSRALLAYRGAADVEDPVVVFCPLHNKIWLQRSEARVGNPYMGAQRTRCGQVLELRTPRWLPSRPASRSPGAAPVQNLGGRWGD